MTDKINIAIIDKHDIYRKGLKVVLGNLPVEVIAESGSSFDLFNNTDFTKAHIILMDIGIQCTECSQNLDVFTQEHPEIKILGMVQHYEQVRLEEMKSAGINGFLLKNTQRKEISDAIETVTNGGFYLPDEYNKLKTKIK